MKDHRISAPSATHPCVADIADALLTMRLANPMAAFRRVLLDRALLLSNGDMAAAGAFLGMGGCTAKLATTVHGLGTWLQ